MHISRDISIIPQYMIKCMVLYEVYGAIMLCAICKCVDGWVWCVCVCVVVGGCGVVGVCYGFCNDLVYCEGCDDCVSILI